MENGYHDNPTLEVMETSSEMQEKKVANLNGELGDSWIVPLDNLTKDDPEEEDTHLYSGLPAISDGAELQPNHLKCHL